MVRQTQAANASFCDVLDFSRLRDMGFNGFLFTWSNRCPSVVIKMFGFALIGVWRQLNGFCISLHLAFTIWMPFIRTINYTLVFRF